MGEAVKWLMKKIVPNLGAGAAAGAAASAAVKATAGLPPHQRAVVVGATSFVTAGATKVGLEIGTSISKNLDITESIKNSKHADPNIDRIPSPDIEINSPLENEITSPLQDLFIYNFTLDLLILFLVLILLFIIFNRYIYIHLI